MSIKSRALVATGAAALAAAGAAVALAQDVPISIKTDVKVTPNKAGTPRHPQGVKVTASATITMPRDVDPPTAQSVDVWFPKAGNYNGGKWPVCAQAVLARSGPDACPPRSIMGHGRAVAYADEVEAGARGTVVNGGARKAYVYVTLQRPARVRQSVPVAITKLSGDPKWGYKAHADIPKSLQIVAGIPLRVDSIRATVGRGDWIATTGCPSDHRWRYHVETHYSTGQVVKTDGSVACRS